jgi:ABC-type multidrug transport system fused ATPase/permease subunit
MGKHIEVSNLALAEAKSDTKLAEFRATIEAYTARPLRACRHARELEAIRAREFEKRMENYAALAAERESAASELEAIRSREFEKRMEAYAARADEHHKASEARIDRIESAIASLKKLVVSASLSTVLGVGAINAALIQNYHAAFDSARHLTVAEHELIEQRQRTDALLSAIEARLAAMPKPGGQNSSQP